MTLTTTGIVEGACYPPLTHVTIDRRATSVERLSQRLMARVLSPRRILFVRVLSLLLLLPVSAAVLTGKAAETLPVLVGKIAKTVVMLSIWLTAIYITAHAFSGDPASVTTLKAELNGLGHWLIRVSDK